MTVVIFQGSKFFWRTRNSAVVTIVEHRACKLIEVICYEPTIDVQASTRVYLDSVALKNRVNHTQIEEKMSFAKRNKLPLTEKFVSDIIHQATADYILNRLFQTVYCVSARKFEVDFQLNFRDAVIEATSNSSDRLIREPPSDLVPFKPSNHTIFTYRGCEKDEAMKAMERAKKNLRERCLAAMALQAQPHVLLDVKDRWRIPIVLGKLAHNRRLSGADISIWASVASNLKTQEDVDRIIKVALCAVEVAAAHQLVPELEHKSEPEPAARPAMGFNRMFLPVTRILSATPTPTPTPVRSPVPTPRSDSRRVMGERANSSLRRANSCADDNIIYRKKPTGADTKKTTSVRRSASRQRWGETSDHSGTHTPAGAAPLTRTASDEAQSFMSQLVAALNAALTCDYNKVQAMPMEGDASLPQAVLTRTRPDADEILMERHHLASLQPHLFATASSSPSLKAGNASSHSCAPSSARKPACRARHLERGTTAEMSGKISPCAKPTSHGPARRSFLGPFLVTLSGRGHPSAHDGSGKWSTKENPSRHASILGFDWIRGGHCQTVVPVASGACQ